MQISKNFCTINQIKKLELEDLDIGIELQCFPQHKLDESLDSDIEIVSKKLKNFNGHISLHGASFDLNPGSTDSRILEVTKYRYEQAIEIAYKLGARHVVFHSQINPLVLDYINKKKMDLQIKFWMDMIPLLSSKDITVVLENEYDETFHDILYIVNSVNSKYLKACLDIGHALAYSKCSIEDWIKNLDKNLEYIHLHWNDGHSDEHNPPSDYDLIYLRFILDKYKLNPIIALEYSVDNLHKEIYRLRKFL